MKTGLLLLNLGTPDDPTPRAVGKYLREFLMDPWVIDIPGPARWALVNLLIVPRRSHTSAEAYQKIWDERGSPLRYHLEDLRSQVQVILGPDTVVTGGMRYGSPSISDALSTLKSAQVDQILVFPLYPQYSLAATESSVRWTLDQARKIGLPEPRFLPAFYGRTEFIDTFARVIRENTEAFKPDFILFSYHGLPERQIKKTDFTAAHCLSKPDCCDAGLGQNPNCYRAQCYATTRSIAGRLRLALGTYETSFQSRLGRTPWIQPYTDAFYRELPQRGIKRLAVVCPAFVADCLETLEEVAMRGKSEFMANGGEDLILVPSLNADPQWARSIANWSRQLSEAN